MNKYKKISISSILIVVLTFNFVLATDQQSSQINNAINSVEFAQTGQKWKIFTEKLKNILSEFAKKQKQTTADYKAELKNIAKSDKSTNEQDSKSKKPSNKPKDPNQTPQTPQQQNPQSPESKSDKGDKSLPSFGGAGGGPQSGGSGNQSGGAGNPNPLGNQKSGTSQDNNIESSASPFQRSNSGSNGSELGSLNDGYDNNKPYYQVDSKWAPKNCGMPQGPMAYAIGGNGKTSATNAKSSFVGFKENIFNVVQGGKYAGGYINPLQSETDEELTFSNYENGPGKEHIAEQLQHWKLQAQNQKDREKCIVVAVDKCDVIGWGNYKTILDYIDNQNKNNPELPKVMVFAKNPHLEECGTAFNHPVVVGAFVEEIDKEGLTKLFKQRGKYTNKPILLLAGSGNNQDRLQKLTTNCNSIQNEKKQKNVFASFDKGSEYENVTEVRSCGK